MQGAGGLFGEFESSNRFAMTGSFIGLFGVMVASFFLTALEMSATPAGGLFNLMPVVFLPTHFGSVWILRVVCIALLSIVWFAIRNRIPSRLLYLSTASLSCVIAMTMSATGHASDAGDFSFPEIMDWFHL